MVSSVRAFHTTGTFSTEAQPSDRMSSWSKKTARMSFKTFSMVNWCGHGQDFQPWLQSDDYLAARASTSQSRHSDESMLDTTGEQKRQPIGIHPPHQCLNSERRSVGRYELQPHGCPGLQSRFGPDFRATGADIQGV